MNFSEFYSNRIIEFITKYSNKKRESNFCNTWSNRTIKHK